MQFLYTKLLRLINVSYNFAAGNRINEHMAVFSNTQMKRNMDLHFVSSLNERFTQYALLSITLFKVEINFCGNPFVLIRFHRYSITVSIKTNSVKII